MNNRILILSRPLSNILDEGSKNLVYYICKYTKQELSVIVEKNFNLVLPKNITKITLNKNIDKTQVGHSHSMLIKFFIIKQILKFWSYSTIHTFFSLTKANVLILLFTKIVLRKNIIANIPTIDKKAENSKIVQLFLRKIDKIIVISEYSLNKIKKYNNNVIKIPPIVDTERFQTKTEEQKSFIKKKLNINRKFVIIVPGEYSRLQMIDNLVKIVNEVGEVADDVLFIFSFRLLFKTDFEKQNELKKRIKHHNVLFINTVQNYEEYAIASDLGLFPVTNMEGKFDLPLALVELIVLGIPVIHTNIEPLNELYPDNELFCIAPDMFVVKLLDVKNNFNLLTKLKTMTTKRLKTYQPLSVIPQYETIYKQYTPIDS